MSKFISSKGVPTQKLETVQHNANAWIHDQIKIVLAELEAALSVDGVIVYDRKLADRLIGRHLALAHAVGFLDKSHNKVEKKLIYTNE